MADQQPQKDAGEAGGSASSQPSQPVNNNDFQFTFQAPATSATIEPDPNVAELRNSSSSLSESVQNYPEEFGRTYHAYRAGSYVFPNDHLEQERLNLQNTALVHLLGNKLYLAPLSQETPPKMILDIATGTGDWAIQMGDEFPSSEIIATDLSPIQPEDVPPNVSFFVEDSSDPWDYTYKFDYIHTRTTAGCWEDFEKQIAQQAFESLNPGGWFESQEFNSIVGCDDDTLKPGMALTNWFHEIAVASEICRRPTVFSNNLAEIYKRVGFVDVEERVFQMPMNGWPKDPQLKQIGRMWERNFMQGLSGFSLTLFNRAYGRTPEETEVLLVDVRREVCDPSIHAFVPVWVVWGRKPRPGETTQ